MTETSSPKKSSFGCLFPAIGAAVLIGGGAAAYWTLNRTGAAEMTAEANAAVLPDETIAIAHLNTATFADLAQFGTPEAQAEVQQRVTTLLSGLSPGLEWERDLKPWVGSITLGLATPLANEPEGGPDLHAYFAIAIRDKLQAIKFASGLQSEAGEAAIESEYEGIKVIQVSPDEAGRGTTLATVGDHLILAGSLDNMKNVIDDIQAKTTASSNDDLQQSLTQSIEVDHPLLQVYIPNTAAFPLPNAAPQPAKEGEPQTPPAPSKPPIRASIATINVTDTGLHGSINVVLNDDRELPAFVPLSDRPETQFPEQTLLLVAGNNLAQTWAQFVARAEGETAIPQTKQALAVLRSGFTSLGLDADRDVFRWMDGEAAIGAFPITSGLLQQFGLAAAVTAETSDRAAATQALGKLSDAIKSRIPVPLTEVKRKAGDIEIQEWTVPVPGVGSGGLFGYGWRDDRNLIVGLSAPAIDAIAQPAASLSANPDFQDVMRDLPTEKTGYAYFNLGQLYQQLQSIPAEAGQLLSPQTTTLLGATRGLGATLASDAPDRFTLNLSLALKPLTASENAPATPEAPQPEAPQPEATPTPEAN